ncbi:hypothetical protein O181_006607 [Austropuccinia psidii MF-1]|uniref:Uncharacterized protein n=1 Tax=Austropuccinia psidii MF-1 TaxID=1389203 RepID=A0A9Q3BL43_9BASI|nr:hypothetical protein [Austropuccinia psidii MF-1]
MDTISISKLKKMTTTSLKNTPLTHEEIAQIQNLTQTHQQSIRATRERPHDHNPPTPIKPCTTERLPTLHKKGGLANLATVQ